MLAMRNRDRFLRALVIFGTTLFLITEALSAFHLIQRAALIVCWVIALLLLVKRPRLSFSLSKDPIVWICLFSIAVILSFTAVTAALSPPNSADAMAYHMPRVVYWAEQHSIRFFPTGYFNQIMLQPLAEYFMLHLYILTGGDRLINFVQWFASLASIVGVSCVAQRFGTSVRGQAIAALFCATLPSGILASSGAKNDYFLAMWLITAIYFAASSRKVDTVYLGAALGLAMLTKATAYLFAPWVLAVFLVPYLKRVAIPLAVALALNAPQYIRNYNFSGSPMGFDSAQGDGAFRWRNDTLGWKPAVSNILRNTAEQLGTRSDTWNQAVYNAVASAHQRLGIDVNDPGTTWRWTAFAAPRNSNHEADAPSRLHLVLLILAACILAWRRDRQRTLYALSVVCAFIAFCTYLKWQPFMARMFLPLFVVGAPLTSIFAELVIPGALLLRSALCLLLLDSAKHPLFDNWVRPLRGPRSIFHVPRSEQYFSDMVQWHNADTYRKTAKFVASTGCKTIGIDIADNHLEYPLQVLLSGARFIHTGVQNASARYAQPVKTSACAVICLDCLGDEKRLALYGRFHSTTAIDRLVVFTEP